MKRLRFRLLTLLIAVIVASSSTEPAFAGGNAPNATITKLTLRKGLGSILLIELAALPTGRPGCASSSWSFSLAMNNTFDDKMYATLLAAFMAGKPVGLEGTGACTQLANVETLQDVYVYD